MSTEETEKSAPPKSGIIGAGLIIVAIIGWMITSGDDESIRPTEVEEVVHDLSNEGGELKPLFTQDDQARQLIVDKQLSEIQTILKNEKEERTRLEDKIEDMILSNRQAVQRQLEELTSELSQSNRDMVENDYLNDREGNATPPDQLFGDIDDLIDGPDEETPLTGPLNIEPKQRNPFGAGYIVLNMSNSNAAIQAENGDSSLSGIPNTIEQRIRDTGSKTSDNMTKAKTSTPSQPQQYSNPEPAVDSTGKQLINVEAYEIPAFSFTQVTTLHGVHCPIGANSVGQSSGVPARPVVIPVRGIFYGPNGSERDIGTAHLYGFCSGFRTSDKKIGRAEIKIVKMSYWDEKGGSQFLEASGYIVDETYNQEIKGEIDNARLAVLGEQSFAAAMVALNSNLSQKEFTNVATDQGSQSVLTGDATKAAATEGVSAAFTEISRFYNDQAEAAVDTVKVPGGLALKFVSDLPLKVFKAADPIDQHSKKYWDILI